MGKGWFRQSHRYLAITAALLTAVSCHAHSTIAPTSEHSTSSQAIISAPTVNPAQTSASTRTSTRPAPTAANSKEATWALLKQGTGYVVMMRHSLAPGTGDPPNFRLDDCSTQRNLSEEGRAQAVRIGEAFRHHNIRVTRVLSSQWCRCLETAELMKLGSVEPFPAINSFFENRATESAQTAQLRQFILDNRETPGVIIMVTHQVNITALSSVVPQSGGLVVVGANEQDRVEVVGQL